MDIHRSRFIPYPASAINALAFSHTTAPTNRDGTVRAGKGDPTSLRLAIGRANGDIEIWNPAKGTWLHEITLHGGKDRSVEGLVWTQEPEEEDSEGKSIPGQLRLFSIGYSSTVTEWNLTTGLPLRHSSGNHSEVWCVAAQPRWTAQEGEKARDGEYLGQNLAVGCADGTLAILNTDNNDLQFQHLLVRATGKRSKVLSITYQKRDVVVAGFADSTIQVFRATDGKQLRIMSLSNKSASTNKTLVWTVQTLPNGDIVSGDSTGEVRIFDGNNYTSISRLKTHETDVLSLGVSQHSKIFFSGGMDRRTVAYTLTGGETRKTASKARWNRLSHRRYHEHDLKAMAMYEGNNLDILVSGGLDINPVIVPIRDFGKQYSRMLPIMPHRPPMISSQKSRLIVSWWDREARIYRIPPKQDDSLPKLCARLALKGDENISCAAITENGSLIALGTAAGVKVFQLSARTRKPDTLRIRKVNEPEIPGARVITFSADQKWLVAVAHSNTVRIARILQSETKDATKILRELVVLKRSPRTSSKGAFHDGLNGSWGRYDRSITLAAFSPDSRVLAVADLGGFIDRWILEGHEDSTAPEFERSKPAKGETTSDDDSSDDDDDEESRLVVIKGQHWIPNSVTLTRLDSSPLILSFRPTANESNKPEPNGNPAVHPTRHNPHAHSHDVPSGDRRLFVVTTRHHFYEFDVVKNKLTDWSRRNRYSKLPEQFRTIKDLAKGCVWDSTDSRERLWLYGSNWLFMFNLSKDFDAYTNENVELTRGKKRNLQEVLDIQKESTGAGDLIKDGEQVGLGRKIRKITVDGQGQNSDWIQEAKMITQGNDDLEEETLALPPLQRDMDGDEADGSEGKQALVPSSNRSQEPLWWHTFKYRPILGMAAIDEQHRQATDGIDQVSPLEVVLVERPFWELDLPPRFEGPHERN